MNRLILGVENARLSIPRRETFSMLVSELRTFTWTETAGGGARADHVQGGHHDCIQALALANRCLAAWRDRYQVNAPARVGVGVAPARRKLFAARECAR
jgi:hypothetical protein